MVSAFFFSFMTGKPVKNGNSAKPWSPVGVFASVVFITLIATARDFFGDPGAGWHLLSGLRLLAGAPIVSADPFSFELDNPLWVSDQWLGDAVFGAIFSAGGFRLVEIFIAATISYSYFFLPGRLLARRLSDFFAVLIALLICASLGSVQWFFRPVIFTFLCFSLLLFVISPSITAPHYTAENRTPRTLVRPLLIALLFAVWANLHPGFFIGLFYLFARLFDRRAPRPGEEGSRAPAISSRLVDFTVAVAATGLNPFGFSLHRSALMLAHSRYFAGLNEEWLPPDLASLPFLFLVPSVLLITFSVFLRDRSAVARSDLTTALFLSCLAVLHRRYAPLAGLASIRPLAAAIAELLIRLGPAARLIRKIGSDLTETERRSKTAVIYPLVVLAAILVAAVGGKNDPGEGGASRFGRDGFSAGLREAVRAGAAECGADASERRPCRIWSSPDYGGLLIWWLYRDPGVQVFIDDRNQLYGQDRYEEYFSAALAEPAWRELFLSRGIDMAYFYGDSPLRGVLESDAEWKKIYTAEDGAAALFQRKRTDNHAASAGGTDG